MDTTLLVVLLAAAAVAAVAFGAIALSGQQREARMRRKFGPEYDRMVEEAGGRRGAVRELRQRAKHVQTLDIKPMTEAERQRFVPAWQDIQARFIEDPKAAVGGADQLVGEVLGERGYTAEDFEQRAADLSVHHPVVVQDYRTAHEISMREADTEDLRQAMLGYRAVFDELVNEGATAH